MKSSYVNWMDEFNNNPERWENEGQQAILRLLEEGTDEQKKQIRDHLGIDEETEYPEDITYENFEPMMNYIYPLESFTTINDETILRVVTETNLTIMYNTDTDMHYLTLTGGGMDLSQDIALAYMILYAMDNEKYGVMDWDMLEDVYIQAPLSVSKTEYIKILETMEYQLKGKISNLENRLKQVRENLERHKEK